LHKIRFTTKKDGKYGIGGFSPEHEKQKSYGEAKAVGSEYANFFKEMA